MEILNTTMLSEDVWLEDCPGCTPTAFNYSGLDLDCTDQSVGPGVLSSPYFQALVTILYSTIFFVALIGNGTVCFIVRAFPRMRTVTNYFIANLALGDILMSVFCVPFSFVPQLVMNHWPFGGALCRLVNYSQAVSVLVSAYTLVALAADRCRAITSPLRPRLTKPAAQAAIAAVWVGALATAAPIPLVSALVKPTPWHEACDRSICREEWPEPEQSYYYSMALLALQFVVPLAVLVFTYTRIAITVWGGRPPGEAENSRDKRMAKSKRKMIKMMVTVVIVFTVCWLPLNILILLWSINVNDNSWDTWEPLPYVWFVFHWLAMSHSCYNPIIYCYMNARFRYGFIQVAAKVPCLRSCLGRAAHRAACADLHNGVSGVGMTENSLHRVNTNTTYISFKHRDARCSCTANNRCVNSASCSPSRSTCSPTRSTRSPAMSTCSSAIGMSPIKANIYTAEQPCSHSPVSFRNRINKNNHLQVQDAYVNGDGYHQVRGGYSQGSVRCRGGTGSPARAASLLTSQGTITASDRRHVSYMEDQI